MTDRATTLAAALVVLGVLAGERLGPSPGGWCLLAAATLGCAAVVAGAADLASRTRSLVPAMLGFLALGSCSAALMQRALDGLDGPVARLASREPEVVSRVHLVEDPRSPSRWNVRVLARIGPPGLVTDAPAPAERTATGAGSVVAVLARGPAAERLRLLSAGESAVLHGWLRPLEGPERRLRWRHATAVLAAGDLVTAAPPTSPALRLANRLRRLVLSGAGTLPSTPAALTAGLLVGDDRGLPPGVAADFRAAGLSHLLAVSGANVALVLALARPVLTRFGLGGRFAGGAAVVAVFGAMARFEPSVLRASAMAGVALLAAAVGRPASGRRLLALAVAGLVLADPFLVHSLGFRLSVAASAGILVLARPLATRIPGPPAVAAALGVTAAAQFGVAPVALPAFGSIPLVAFPANLLAAPAAAALTLWGFGSGLAGGLLEPVLPAAAGGLALPTGILAGYLAGVAAWAARWPLAVGPGAGLALVVVSAAALAARRAGPGSGSRSAPPRAGRRGREVPVP